jgi:SAM-dependent methyltransferase
MTDNKIPADERFIEHYKNGYAPWDIRKPDQNLIRTIMNEKISPCKTLDMGCGTGNNAIWLASQGFRVTGCDVSDLAIAEATKRAASASVVCHFQVGDFLKEEIHDRPFELVFDRGFFHTFDERENRAFIAKKVSTLLVDDGLWLSLMGSADEPREGSGPPQRTAMEIVEAVEPYFFIQSLVSGVFTSNDPVPPKIWICLMRKRK